MDEHSRQPMFDPDFCEHRCPICTRARRGSRWAKFLQAIEMIVTFGGCPWGRARQRKYGVKPSEPLPPILMIGQNAETDKGAAMDLGSEAQVNGISLALYVDLENLPKGVDFERLLKQLSGDGRGVVFAVKAAYGNACQIAPKLREQMRDHNFRFIDTPHLAGKKNRADLMISVDAFERLHVNVPPVDRYVFVSGDADFSVIMDKLRSYGKQVWLVCRRGDQHRTILSRSCDKMLFIENFTGSKEPSKVVPPSDGKAEALLKLALRNIGPQGLPVNLAVIGNTMRQIDREFKFSGSGFKRLTDLAQHVEKKGILRLGRDGKGEVQIEDVDD